MATSKQVRVTTTEPGKPTVTIDTIPIPEPGRGEVLVQIYLRPVNPYDFLVSSRIYPSENNAAGVLVPGTDAVGRVVKSGPGTAGTFSPGQRVVSALWSSALGGTWQQYLTVPESELIAAPDALSDLAASQFRVNPFTAYGFLEVVAAAGVKPGGWIYNDAANSELGRSLIRLAKRRGYRIAAVVRRPDQVEPLRALGADLVIDSSTSEGVAAEVRAATNGGRGVDVAFTAIAGDAAATAGAAARDDGVVIVYGSLSGEPPRLDAADQARGVKFGERFVVFKWFRTISEAQRADVMSLILDGTLGTDQGKVVPLDQVQGILLETLRPSRGPKYFLEG